MTEKTCRSLQRGYLKTVSYTHLDVYKRQLLGSSQCSIKKKFQIYVRFFLLFIRKEQVITLNSRNGKKSCLRQFAIITFYRCV